MKIFALVLLHIATYAIIGYTGYLYGVSHQKAQCDQLLQQQFDEDVLGCLRLLSGSENSTPNQSIEPKQDPGL